MNGSGFLFDPSWEADSYQPETDFAHTYSHLVPNPVLSHPVTTSNAYEARRYASSIYPQRQQWRAHTLRNQPSETGLYQSHSLRRVPHPLKSNDRVTKSPARNQDNLVVRKTRQARQLQQSSSLSSLASNVSTIVEQPIGPQAASRSSTQSFINGDPRSHSINDGSMLPIAEPTYSIPSDEADMMANKDLYPSESRLSSHYEPTDLDDTYATQPLAYNVQFSNCWDVPPATNPTSIPMGYYALPTTFEVDPSEHWVFPAQHQPYDPQVSASRRTFSLREPLPTSVGKRPARKHFTPEVTNVLKTWFKENSDRPYPSEETKQELLRQTGLTMNQLSNWFINARRRNWRRPRLSKE